jgi:hypothetical protein
MRAAAGCSPHATTTHSWGRPAPRTIIIAGETGLLVDHDELFQLLEARIPTAARNCRIGTHLGLRGAWTGRHTAWAAGTRLGPPVLAALHHANVPPIPDVQGTTAGQWAAAAQARSAPPAHKPCAAAVAHRRPPSPAAARLGRNADNARLGRHLPPLLAPPHPTPSTTSPALTSRAQPPPALAPSALFRRLQHQRKRALLLRWHPLSGVCRRHA